MGKATLVCLVTGLLLLASTGCSKFAQTVSSGAGNVANPMAVTLELAKYPKLYEPVEVTVTVTARHFDVPAAEAWIRIPPQAIYVSGDLAWKGDLIQSQPAQFAATLAFIVEGPSRVSASIWALPPAGSGYGGIGGGNSVSLEVGKDSGSAPQDIDYANQPPQSLTPPDIARLPFGGGLFLRDSGRLLNLSDRPRLLVIDTRERLEQLQQEGLIPRELTDQWHQVDELDFDKYLLIAVYDRGRPDSASNIRIRDVVMERATRIIKVSAESVSIPPDAVRASRPTSAVNIARFHKSNLKYLGEQTFELVMNQQAEVHPLELAMDQEAIDRDSINVEELVVVEDPVPAVRPQEPPFDYRNQP